MSGNHKTVRRVGVMHLIETGGPGGAESIFTELANSLDLDGARPLVVVPREGWLSENLRQLGIQPLILGPRGPLSLRYVWQLVRSARRHETRLIVSHLAGASTYAAMVGLITRIPVIAILHGPTDLRYAGRMATVRRWLLNHGCAAIVAVSSSTREALVEFGLRENSITLVRNGVDTEAYSPGHMNDLRAELGLKPDDLLVGAVGNIREPKAYDILLNAAHFVSQTTRNCHFVIVGEGRQEALRSLEDLRRSLHLDGRVHFAGFRQTSANLYRNFDVFVSSSSSEGLSLAFLEAMACGLPVVATRSGGPQEVIDPGISGLLVPVADPAALAEALSQALRDPELRGRLGDAARAQVVDAFSKTAMLREYRAICRNVLAGEQ